MSASLQDTIARYLVRDGIGALGRARCRARVAAQIRSCPSRQDAGLLASPTPCRLCPLLPATLQEKHSDLAGLSEKACFQMNDTHPTIAVRLLWGRAAVGCRRVFERQFRGGSIGVLAIVPAPLPLS